MILITGGRGYVGSAIAKNLKQQYQDKKIIISSQKAQSEQCWEGSDFLYAHYDCFNQEALRALCQNVEAIIHLAAIDETKTEQDPNLALQVNTLGTLNLLEAAKLTGVKRFIYFSTAHVYGTPLSGILSESSCTKPLTHYALTHKFAEDYVLAYSYKNPEFCSTVFRLSNAIGVPGNVNCQRWTLLVNDLCKQAVTQQQLVLRSTGLQYRDFITLADVGVAVKYFLNDAPPIKAQGVFNLGSGISMRVIEMAQLIQQRYKALFDFLPPIIRPASQQVEADHDQFMYSNKKIVELGVQFNHDLARAIDETLLFCHKLF